MFRLLSNAAGLALALLISSPGAVLAETSPVERCGWVCPAFTSKPKTPKFSLNVVLRAFSFAKPSPRPPDATNATDTPNQLSAGLELRQDRVDTEFPFQSSRLLPLPDHKPIPNFLSWMRGWRLEKDRGLFRPIRSRSRLALSYCDVFENGGDPDKGGHGLSLLFRHDFAVSRHLN